MSDLEILNRRFERERKARKEAERLLEAKSRELFFANQQLEQVALFAELNPHPVMRVDKDGLLLLANPSARRFWGSELKAGASITAVLPALESTDLESIIEQDQVFQISVQVDEYYFQFVVKGIKQFGYANLYGTDITQREHAKLQIQKAHRDTEQLLASISSILIEVDNQCMVRRWNSAAEDIFGISEYDVLGKPFAEIGIQWALHELESTLNSSEFEDHVTLNDVSFVRGDEKTGYLTVIVNKVKNVRDELTGYLILATDITERKLLESQLLQAQKLESLGQLAAGIAHEINTPIQFIGDNTRFLEAAFQKLDSVLAQSNRLVSEYKEGHTLDALIEEVEKTIAAAKMDYMRQEIPFAIEESLGGVNQVATIVKAMKQFSHPGRKNKSLNDINEAIENTINVARNEWKYVADVVTDLDKNLPPVPSYNSELNQVFLNIIVNAAHAIGEGLEGRQGGKGTITISTRAAGAYAEIRIADTGPGIPEEIRKKVFDPFFTTKEVGKGTGQGLSVAYGVIYDKHQGTIDFESKMGEGTTFIIKLPLQSTEQEVIA